MSLKDTGKGRADTVEMELWNVFTYYALVGNPSDPEHLRKSEFLRICRDALITPSITKLSPEKQAIFEDIQNRHEHYEKNMVQAAETHVIYASVIRSNRKGERKCKMTYHNFLDALMKVALEIYGVDSNVKSVEDAFQQLLVENLLRPGLAMRRRPSSFKVLKETREDPEVRRLLRKYASATKQLFFFYASKKHQKTKALRALHQKDVHMGTREFAEMSLEKSQARAHERERRWKRSEQKQIMSYDEYFKFVADFDLSLALKISSVDVGEIFLCAMSDIDNKVALIRHLHHQDFVDAIVLFSLTAYEKKIASYAMLGDKSVNVVNAIRAYENDGVSNANKIRSFFLQMYRNIQHIEDTIPKARVKLRNVNMYDMDLRQAASKFMLLFGQEWLADEFCDYLAPPPKFTRESKEMQLERMLKDNDTIRRRDEDKAKASVAPFSSSSSSSSPSPKLDSRSVETVRSYLKTRPELKGLLRDRLGEGGRGVDDSDSAEAFDVSRRIGIVTPTATMTTTANGSVGVGTIGGEYERAMNALRSHLGDGDGDDYAPYGLGGL